MKLYLAPMEGITGIDFRQNLNKHFGNVDVYTTAFIPASKNLNKKQIRDLDPDNNQGMKLVPQLIGNDAQEMLDMCRKMQSFGYDEININLGCPSGTVTSKKRGSGLLLYPEMLDHFLEELFSATDMKVSVKTRIGYFSTDEWEELLEIYARYPLQELIIHPRIRQEFYSKTPHYDAFARAVDKIRVPLVYNGDIDSPESFAEVQSMFPGVDRFMIGRGLIAHPDLCRVLKGGPRATKEEMRAYHDDLIDAYLQIFSGPRDMIFHMKEVWSYMKDHFEGSDTYWKKLKKASDYDEYLLIVKHIFENCEPI